MPESDAERLKWKTRQVALILALDRLRDELTEGRALAAAMVNAVVEALSAEAGLLYWRDEDSGELTLAAVRDRAGLYGHLAQAGAMLEAAAAIAAARPATGALPALERQFPLADGGVAHGFVQRLRVGGESLGALILLNHGRPFHAAERELASMAASQIDSALQHIETVRTLRQRTRQLEVVFRVDHLRDTISDFQTLLDAVLAEVCSVTTAEVGFIMLYDRAGQELELRAAAGHSALQADAGAQLIRAAADEAIQTACLVSRTVPDGPLGALAAMPLILNDRVIGVLGIGNGPGRSAFRRADVELLQAIVSQMDTAIFRSLETLRLREVFGRSVGPQVMDRLLSIGDRDLLSGERVVLTTLFSDIRGFTTMSEHVDETLLQEVLNDHLSALTSVALAREGTLDKYIGDSVMCIFNAPERQPDHALRAVQVALEMQAAHREVMARWAGRVSLPPIGIGISTGATIVGNFGSASRLEYTVIGPDVNLASRLCAAAEGGQTLISRATYDLVGGRVAAEALAPMRLKGIAGDVPVWNVTGLR